MTIGPGTEWSRPGLLAPGAPILASDRELSDLAQRFRMHGGDLPEVGVVGGTLWQTIGGASVKGRLYTPEARHYDVDLVRVELGGMPFWFVGSLVARTFGARHVLAVMNTPWFGALRLGHRSHPGDALVDVTEAANLTFDDLRKIIPRARHGAHTPHPKLKESRVREATWTFEHRRRVTIDGRNMGRFSVVSITVEPDAMVVVV